VMIDWNRSTETARTVAMALPILAQADSIIVLEVEDWGAGAATGDDLAKALRRQGFNVASQTVRDNRSGAGPTVLAAAAAAGCDLLVKGAYTQSRIRQMIFGGATSHILARTELPVFMAH
jgi:nucleotide-binding universal stress UspA family protein